MKEDMPCAIYDIKFTPFKDRHDISIKILNDNFNIKVDDLTVSPIDTLINIYYTLIPQKERGVVESKNLSCPEKVKNGYELLKVKISKGINLNPHLSKQVFNPKFNDGMHLDFGLYHFHLGGGIENDKRGNVFSERSGPLLVAYVTDTTIYCLGIFEHSSELWSSSKLIEVIDEEWPHLIEHKKVTLATDISPVIEDKDRAKFRKNGLNTVVTLANGSSYLWLGDGIAASGGSAKAGMYVVNSNRLLLRNTPYFIKDVIERDYFKEGLAIRHGDINLRLVCLPSEKITAIDTKTGMIYHADYEKRRFITIYPSYLPRYAIFKVGVELRPLSLIINALLKVNEGGNISVYLQYPSIYNIPKMIAS